MAMYKNSEMLSRNRTASRAIKAAENIRKNPTALNVMYPTLMPKKKDLPVYDKDPIEESLKNILTLCKITHYKL